MSKELTEAKFDEQEASSKITPERVLAEANEGREQLLRDQKRENAAASQETVIIDQFGLPEIVDN